MKRKNNDDGAYEPNKIAQMNPDNSGDQRREVRRKIECDILWSYASNPVSPQYEGTLFDINRLGLGIITNMPVKGSKILRIYAKDLWKGPKYATVMWTEETSTGTYRTGLLFTVPSRAL